jgi:hypothetical protein
MQYSLADALADESLPYWWTEKGCPEYARHDDYRHIDCPMLIYEIRHGLPEAELRVRLSHRKYNARKRAERIAQESKLTPEQREERRRRKSEGSALRSRQNRVSHWRKKLTDAQARKAAGDWLFAPREVNAARQYLADAEAKLSEYLTHALAAEFKRLD